MAIRKKNLILIGIVIALIVIGIFFMNFYNKGESFSLRGALIQLNLPLGGEASINNIKVINNEKNEQTFHLKFENLEEITSLDEQEFFLNPDGKKDIILFFNDSFNEVKTYVGKLIIDNSKIEKEVPIIINIVDERSPFSIIQTPLSRYSEVYSGEDFGIQIKLFDSSSSDSKSINVIYSLMNFEGDILERSEGNIIVGDSWTKIISIPKDFEKGDYVFIASIDYKGIKTNSAYKFSVKKKEMFSFFEDAKFFMIIIFVFVFGILVLFFYFIQSRDELLIALKKQQTEELSKSLKFVKKFHAKSDKIKDKVQRKKKIKKLKKVEKRIVKKIKRKQKAQRKEFKILKKKKKRKHEIQRKFEQWKKQGYKMQETSEEMKFSNKEINKKLKNLKGQGYKF